MREFTVARQAKWANDLVATVVEFHQKMVHLCDIGVPRRLTILHRNEANYGAKEIKMLLPGFDAVDALRGDLWVCHSV